MFNTIKRRWQKSIYTNTTAYVRPNPPVQEPKGIHTYIHSRTYLPERNSKPIDTHVDYLGKYHGRVIYYDANTSREKIQAGRALEMKISKLFIEPSPLFFTFTNPTRFIPTLKKRSKPPTPPPSPHERKKEKKPISNSFLRSIVTGFCTKNRKRNRHILLFSDLLFTLQCIYALDMTPQARIRLSV